MEDSATVALLISVDKSADVTAPPPSVSRELKAVEIVLSKKTVYSDKPATACTSLAKLVVFGRVSTFTAASGRINELIAGIKSLALEVTELIVE
jgi:hypothetical protein